MVLLYQMNGKVNIKNRKARFNYELLETFQAGIVLSGTEIKSIRNSKASIAESFCEFNEGGELFVINMQVDPYSHGSHFNHQPKAARKLLLQKKELRKLRRAVETTGLTIIPLNLYINGRGLAKLTIALARGKKRYDKRETIKERESKRRLDRVKKAYNT